MKRLALGLGWAFWLAVNGAAAWPADWLQFRGPNSQAVSDVSPLPAGWSADQGIAWKRPLPGPGSSSPIVVGSRVFVTCYSGYGTRREAPGETGELKRHLLCLELRSGNMLWSREIAAVQPEAGYVDFMPQHGYATSTPASDGERVYVLFGKSGLFAFDLLGNQVWHADVGARIHSWGVGASPIVHGDLVIVNSTIESYSIQAFNKQTGAAVWKAKNLNSSWCTPVLVDAPGGKPELAISVLRKVVGLDPATGEELWSHATTQSHCAPSPVAAGGMVYCVDSAPSRLFAIRAGSRGKLEPEQLTWTSANVGSGVSSPVLHAGYLYTAERGVLACIKAATGEIAYRQRLSGGGVTNYASPIVADGKLYLVSREQGTFVVAASPVFKELAANRMAGDDSVFNATPAVGPGCLLLRSDQFVYCVGAPQ